MNALRRTTFLRAPRLANQRISHIQRRTYAADPPPPHPPSSPPNPNDKPPSRVTTFYKTFSYPILKAFLGALFTYQLAYYLWFKLEVVEEKFQRQSEIALLKADLKEAVAGRKGEVRAGQRADRKDGEGEGEGVKEGKGEGRGWWVW